MYLAIDVDTNDIVYAFKTEEQAQSWIEWFTAQTCFNYRVEFVEVFSMK